MVRRLLFIVVMCVFAGMNLSAQQIVRYQYWMDSDDNRPYVSSTSNDNITLSLSTDGLKSGLHVLNFRAQDAEGLWTPVNRILYYIPDMMEGIPLTKYIEYWIDGNYDNRILKWTGGANVSFSISTAGQQTGLHVLNVRTLYATGTWTHVERMLYYIAQETEIVAVSKNIRYWVDEDFENRIVKNINGTAITLSLPTTGQLSGLHVINCQIQDSNGEWGHIERMLYYIPEEKSHNGEGVNTDGSPVFANHYEYWLDNDYNERICKDEIIGNYLDLADIDISYLEAGTHYFNFRVRNSNGQWSSALNIPFEISDNPDTKPFEFDGKTKPYALLSNGVLTFFYDDQYANKEGSLYDVAYHYTSDGDKPGWFYVRSRITKVVFDDSFSKYNPTSTAYWFNGLANLTAVEGIEHLTTKYVTDMSHMFASCEALKRVNVSDFLTGDVNDFSYMFSGCHQLDSLDVSCFNTVKATSMAGMFNECRSLTNVDVTGFATTNVTTFSEMFRECSSLSELFLTNFVTSKVVDMGNMFNSCTNLKTIYARDNWDVSKVTESSGIFVGCTSVVGGKGTAYDSAESSLSKAWIDGDLGKQGYFTYLSYDDGIGNTYAVLDDEGTLTFYCDDNRRSRKGTIYGVIDNDPKWLYDRDKIKKAKFDTSFAVYYPVSTAKWFYNCSNLESIEGLENLKTDNVTTMAEMFRFSGSLTSLDVTHFNTQNVRDMTCMFCYCSSLSSLDVSNFCTENVVDMQHMFHTCPLRILNLRNFDTSKVTNMNTMFSDCTQLRTIYVSSLWSKDFVRSSNSMFYDCYNLVGGCGTKFDSRYTDATYALIDEGEDNPGYLTDVTKIPVPKVTYSLVEWPNIGDSVEHQFDKEPKLTMNDDQFEITTMDGKNIYPFDSVNSFTLSKKISMPDGSTPNPDVTENRYESVDLGLSVEWATVNVGASLPENYGDRFAWGETHPYNSSTGIIKDSYIYYEREWKDWVIYTNIGENISGSQYDAAHTIWGGDWRMPTREEIKELMEKCVIKQTVQNGIEGHQFTGPNGNSIFLPAAGQRAGSEVLYENEIGMYWSATLDIAKEVDGVRTYTDVYLLMNSGSSPALTKWDRSTAHSIRPVRSKTNLDLSDDAGIIVYKLDGTKTTIPIDSLINIVPFTEQTSRAFVSGESQPSDQPTSTEQNGHQYVDLGVSVGWATCNIGADTPEQKGSYFSWGETTPKSIFNEGTYEFGYPPNKYNEIDGLTELLPQDDAARANWGGHWRLPTRAEEEELYSKCTWEWTTVNGVDGFNVIGTNGNSIFLPTTGLYDGDSTNKLKRGNTGGWYWASTARGDNFACGICFPTPNYLYRDVPNHERWDGHAIRPVIGELESELRGIVVSLKNGETIKIPANDLKYIVTYPRTEVDIVIGDVNGDGEIGMPDVMFIVNYILGTPDQSFNAEAADANRDGEVGMPDVMFIVNYILNGKFPDE